VWPSQEKNASLGPFTGYEHQNCCTNQKQVFEPHHMIFKNLKGKKKQFPSQCFCKEKKNAKKYKNIVLEGGSQLFADFHS
jgi:hypothetical protein